ncbi:MAG TPA: glycosyltransferase family 39 protein [Pseudolabrys sp.]|nr:glycosyltransferase family 39 protein [Pseudolabrys sp.]
MTAASPYDLAVAGLIAALVVLVFATYGAYAVSNDEPVQQHYGELIIAYFRSGFTDTSLFHYVNLYLYGGLFDVVATLFERALPFLDPYDVRHILCAFTGIAGIGAAFAIARLVAGARAGAIAAFALAACGPWYGSMFNHTKDIPFGAAMAGAAYFLLRAMHDLPRPRRRHVMAFGVLLGAALGIRVLGLLMVGYAGLAILIAMRRASEAPRDRLAFFAESAVAVAPAFAVAYVLMIAAWPWSALSPLNPVRGLIDFGEFHYHIDTLLAGHVYEMDQVPRWYVPFYLVIKLPLIVLAGALVSLLCLARHDKARAWRRADVGLIVFMALFPVACEVVDRGPAFTGMRHFLFVVPLFAVLAGIGLDWLMLPRDASRRWIAYGAAAAVVVAIMSNAVLLVRLHPYQYLYYNPLIGGLEGAQRRFATDYWVSIMPEAVDDLEGYVAKLGSAAAGARRYTVAVCGERASFEDEAHDDPSLQWTEDWSSADFFIAPTHMNCDRALDGKVIATISRLGVMIGVVKDRRGLSRQAAHRN